MPADRRGGGAVAAALADGQGGIAEAKRRYLQASTAAGRSGRLTTGARGFVTFMVHVVGVSPIQPADASPELRRRYEGWLEDYACWYVEYRPFGRFVSAKTVGKYVSEARAWYRRLGYGVPLGVGAAASRIPAMLHGMRHVVPQPPPRERIGVAPQHLAVGMERRYRAAAELERAMWRSALTFGLAALARACEFALDASRGEVFEPDQHMMPSDVRFFRGDDGILHAEVSMRKRKDMQVLRGKHARVVLAGGGSLFDPVRELVEWLRVRRAAGISDSRPLFCTADGGMITTQMVRDEVRATMAAAGRDPAVYGGHSLRIGGATAALAAGVSPTLIRLLGRWSSDVYEIYCRMSRQVALGVGRALASTEVTSLEGGFHEEHLEL